MSEIHEAAVRYQARGWRLVLVEPFGKKAISKAWQNATPGPESFASGNNVGVKLGKASGGLVDIDLDIMEAKKLAREIPFFAQLPAFGREGELPGHLLAICSDAPQKDQRLELANDHGLNLQRNVVLELRCNGQTVFPPSVLPHKVNGEPQPVVWAAGAEPSAIPTVEWAELEKQAGRLAFLAVILAAYPTQGIRDETCMALAGTLLRAGVAPDEADQLIGIVARLANDEEARQRIGKAKAAAARIADGGEVTGFPRLVELLGLESCAGKLRTWLGLGEVDQTPKVAPAGAIEVRGGDINRIVDEAETALIAKGEPIYQRGGELVRATHLDVAQTEDGIRRRAGSIVLLPVKAPWLILAMARSATWVTMKEKGPTPVDPEPKYANALLGRAGEWRFPPLAGLANAPLMDRDGRLIQKPGYDPESRLLLDFEDGAFPPIPEQPTKEDAEAALEVLCRPLRGFPFADAASEAVALAAILTGLIRPAMQTAPLHAFDSPTPGTGKSLLTSIIGVIVTGKEPSAMSQGKDEAEDEKRLGAALRSGDPVLLIDNCERELTGDFLCSMMTQQMVSPRILGVSELMHLPCRVLVMATGNNLRIAADMTRRAVKCRLDARVEQPEKRDFDFDCVKEAREDRAALVAAGLTILRAYIVAGRPGKFPKLGSFDDYDIVRGALLWLGKADPDASRAAIIDSDPTRALLAEILNAWRAVYGDRPIKVNEIANDIQTSDPGRRLHDLLLQAGGGKWDAPKIGQYLAKNIDRPIDGLALRAVKVAKINRWMVAKIGDDSTSAGGADGEADEEVPSTTQEALPF